MLLNAHVLDSLLINIKVHPIIRNHCSYAKKIQYLLDDEVTR